MPDFKIVQKTDHCVVEKRAANVKRFRSQHLPFFLEKLVGVQLKEVRNGRAQRSDCRRWPASIYGYHKNSRVGPLVFLTRKTG